MLGQQDPLITDSFRKQFIIIQGNISQHFNIRRIYSMLPSGKGTTYSESQAILLNATLTSTALYRHCLETEADNWPQS